MLNTNENGLYCEAGDFYIDPWQPVDRAIITHAHGDHAMAGTRHYLCAKDGENLLRQRVGEAASIAVLNYGAAITLNGVKVSLHPAGHILGSAQVRLEHRGEIWTVSGDYKLTSDPTCAPFEPVACHTFVTESTFGLPIYRWPDVGEVFADIHAWWRTNQEHGRTSVLFGYSLGKAQRLLVGLDGNHAPILIDGAVARFLPHYKEAGVEFPPFAPLTRATLEDARGRALILAPPMAARGPWLRSLGEVSTAFASGWMLLRGTRRRAGLDRGFVLSDHADWSGLLHTIRDTGAERILVTHGYIEPLVRWLRENGIKADPLETRFVGEGDTAEETPQFSTSVQDTAPQ
jgi:putative mRNA 3-end processing factor